MKFLPFRALRARSDLAARIACPPYDVVSTQEAQDRARREPESFIGVIRPEALFPTGEAPPEQELYAAARRRLAELVHGHRLVFDPRLAYYAYELQTPHHRQLGLVGLMAVEDYEERRVRRHEQTREDKLLDRIRHMEAVGAQTGLVQQFHTPLEPLRERLRAVTARPPEVDFTADGVRHRLWQVADPESLAFIREASASLPATYIADGHHRAEAGARVGEGQPQGSPRRFFLTALFPEDELRIEGYHRLVRDLGDHTPETFLEALRHQGFALEPAPDPRPPRPGTFGLVLGSRTYRLRYEGERSGTLLDVSLLDERILGPLLGITDPRRDQRLDFAGGERGLDEVVRKVRDGTHSAGFVLHPVSISHIRSVADAGGILPPKSTWFSPKLLSGLVLHSFEMPARWVRETSEPEG